MVGENIQKGIITRIYLKNFVTYDEVVIKPGKSLNLIIGANGTGKSTIVSAIVLGLGGNPKVIGRAQHVGEFVKAGEKNAIIKIDLQSDKNKFVTVTRSFDAQSKTTWVLNDTNVTSKQIAELMRNFNIQVDNLCQFLPQDKVQEFSNMTPHDLLVETERSVGDPVLLDNHLKLKQLRTKQVELEKDLESKSRLFTKEKQAYESLKDSVGHINEQKQVKKKLKTLKQKRAWLLYQNKRDEFSNAKKGRDQAREKKNKIEKKLKPIQDEISKLKSSIVARENAAKQHNTETSAKTVKLSTFLDEIDKYERSIIEIETKCDREVKDEQKRDERIDQLRQQKDKMENDLRHLINNIGTVESLQEQFNETTPTMNVHRQTLNNLKSQENFFREKIDHLNRRIGAEEENLQLVQDIENKRLEMLQRLSNDAYRGVQWLRENQHLFSKTVHEPMLLKINLKDASYSKYFENVISQRDLTAFVCEDKNDMNLLIRYLRDQQKLKINAVHSDPDKEINDQPSIPLNYIQQYGFEHYLISLIDAPKTILSYLLNMYRINEIPIGSDRVASNLEQIPDKLSRFFSNNNSYSVSRSKYTREKSTRQAVISSRGVLSITVDTERLNYIQHQLVKMTEERDARLRELEGFTEKFSAVNEKIESLKEIRNKLQNNLGKIQDLKVRINCNDSSMQKLQTGRKSIDEIRKGYKKEIQTAILEQLKYYQKYNKLLDDSYKNVITNEEMKLQIKLMKNKLAIKENDSHDLREEFANAERIYKMLESELTPLKDEVKNLYELAKESTGGLCYENEAFTPIKNAFARLPATLEEIFEEIQTTQAKIFCLTNDQQESERILQQYNNAKKNMESLNHKIGEQDEELKRITDEIIRIRDQWLPVLTALVEKINNNFSNYFTTMKCAGEVSLSTGDNPMDFDKYGLKIRVKFRDADELQVLTRTHQSGGERAVTTAVYMIALQELTRVPFRCVDEINQGMDATNERRVFELIVDITSKLNSSQYFLLTPKLLPDLKYNESISVLTVFNGKFMVPSSQFDIHDKCNNIINAVIRRRSVVH